MIGTDRRECLAGRRQFGWAGSKQAGTLHSATYAQRVGRRRLPQRAAVQQLPCSSDPELFFAESPEDVRRAKALCGTCPVQSACLAGALQRAEPHGVWGGALFQRGAIAPDKRPRGRPRKSATHGPAAGNKLMAGSQH
jgi:WhiB family transcriptional regulator, redox-sensing transcriptional regulator